jgi:hypothetical protein
MSWQGLLVSNSSDNTQRFNREMILSRKQNDLVKHIEEICKALEFIENFEFLGLEYVPEEDKINTWNRVNIGESRLEEVEMVFKLKLKEEEEIVRKRMFIPKLVDNFFFVLNGVKYFPIHQIVDRGVFVSPKAQSYSIKTLFMPIRFEYRKITLKSINGDELEGLDFKLNLFKQKLPFILYFLAKKGLGKTCKYFGLSYNDDLCFYDENEIDVKTMKEHADDHYFFQIGKKYHMMVKKTAINDEYKKSVIFSLAAVLKDSFHDKEKDRSCWLKLLGSKFTKNTNTCEEKAEKVLLSLERILDENTKKILSNIEDKDKKNTYSLIRWMMKTFETNRFQNNMSLGYKRVQCWEYVSQPLLRSFNVSINRILNTRGVTMKTLRSIFNIGPNFLIKRLLVNELLRYSGTTNNIELFGAALKITFKGQGSIAEGSDVSDKQRGLHPSYIGNLSLVSTSAGDPGLSTLLSPFSNLKNGIFELPTT